MRNIHIPLYTIHRWFYALLIVLLSIHVAVAQKRPDNLDTLLKSAFESGQIEHVQETYSNLGKLLEIAAANGDISLVKELLDYGAPVEGSHDAVHCSPLNKAAKCNQLEVVKLLIVRGANPNSADHHVTSPICSAAYNHHKSIVAFLLSQMDYLYGYSEDRSSVLHCAAEAGWEDLIPQIIAIGGGCSVPDAHRQIPLHRLARSCFFDKETETTFGSLTMLLLDKGFNAIAQDSKDRTPLHYAARYGNDTIAKVIIQANSSAINKRDKHGRTALYYATNPAPNIGEERLEGTRNIINMLLKKGGKL